MEWQTVSTLIRLLLKGSTLPAQSFLSKYVASLPYTDKRQTFSIPLTLFKMEDCLQKNTNIIRLKLVSLYIFPLIS